MHISHKLCDRWEASYHRKQVQANCVRRNAETHACASSQLMVQCTMAGLCHMHALPLLAIACPSGVHELAEQDQTDAPQARTVVSEDCSILAVKVSSTAAATASAAGSQIGSQATECKQLGVQIMCKCNLDSHARVGPQPLCPGPQHNTIVTAGII